VTTLACLVCALTLQPVAAVQPQLTTPGGFLSRSFSGQFIIQSTSVRAGSPVAGLLENDTNFVRLDPTLLTVSCERIKQILWRELATTTAWKGKIFLRLYPPSSADDPVSIDLEQFRDGWQYCVTLPEITQRERYVFAIVNVLLLEFANRDAQVHSAELPMWLTEGLAREIFTSSQREIILPPPQASGHGLRMTTLMVNVRNENPLEQAHQELSAGPPLSFQQLSWPAPEQLIGEAGKLYRGSAQLFVHQLLSLPGGRAGVRAMLEDLPHYYNWQFAFLNAFHDSFKGPLDVEKWWSLQLVHFTGRELAETWSPEKSWQKLDELVRSAVQVRIGTNELPLHAEVALQTIIRDWPTARQAPALENKMLELQMLRLRLSRDLGPLVDDYCRTIESYLQNLNHAGSVLPFRKHTLQRRNAQEAVQHLDELDARRAALRPALKAPSPMQADSRATPLP
jgi:hypothetical protein